MEGVFPAYAGMFHIHAPLSQSKHGFPRIRGDVPISGQRNITVNWFSPHTRGCSDAGHDVGVSEEVFPAYAGMFRSPCGGGFGLARFPRIRGDVPNQAITSEAKTRFSPHTRGCSESSNHKRSENTVFPAYAGMFRRHRPISSGNPGFPRIRGDVPSAFRRVSSRIRFSPHTRGCSASQELREWLTTVFPAYAGMFRLPFTFSANSLSFPRIRGDVPLRYLWGIRA